MNTDIRVAVDFFAHHKTRKLKKRLGAEGVLALVQLWTYAAKLRPDGDLDGMSAEDIELAADWNGEDGAFVAALADVGFLDGADGSFALHDWLEHNPWAGGSDSRSDASRLSRMARSFPDEYQALLQAGVRGISKADYEELKLASNPAAVAQRIINDSSTVVERSSTIVERSLNGRRTIVEIRCNESNDRSSPAPVPVLKKNLINTPSGCLSPLEASTPTSPALPLTEKQPTGQETPPESNGENIQPEGNGESQKQACATEGQLSAALEQFEPEPPDKRANVPRCPYDAIVALYHETFPEHPRVKLVDKKRMGNMRARWADVGTRLRVAKQRDGPQERLDYLRRFFQQAAQSDILTGKKAFKDGSVYLVNFDKLMSPGGFVGVIEGKYDNDRNQREYW